MKCLLWAVLILSLSERAALPNDRPLWTDFGDLSPALQGRNALPASLSGLITRARPAVVSIHTLFERKIPGENVAAGLIQKSTEDRERGIGSGFAIREDGFILTSHHVIEHATRIKVQVEGLGVLLPARVLGSDARSDVALLKVDPPIPMVALALGNSKDLPVGSWVVALGNPFGLSHVATKGIVSGKGRALTDLERPHTGYDDFIQTDATIDFGSSGGPLVDLNGAVVGVNSAINSKARGIGFAVPIDLVKAVLPHLQREGCVRRSSIGIVVDDVSWELAVSYGLKAPCGILVSEVKMGTPAEKAGMKSGDIILSVQNVVVSGIGDLSWRLGTSDAGKPLPIGVWRDRQSISLSVVPVPREARGAPMGKKTGAPVSDEPCRLGLEVSERVVVKSSSDDAALVGISAGDIIIEINGSAISSAVEFFNILRSTKKGEIVRLLLLRQNSPLYVAFPKRWDKD
jgi:serine protease Do